MDLMKVLKNEDLNIRITNGNSWLVWYNDCYCVFYRGYGQKKTRTLIETDNFENALDVLIDNR